MRLLPPTPGTPLPNLTGATLVLPAVAFANIGELAIDMLITTLQAPLAGRLDDDSLLACAGNNPYAPAPPGQLATAAELHALPSPGGRLFLLQQRAPAIPGRQAALAVALVAWAKAAGAARLLLLAGLDAQYRREGQLQGSQLRHLSAAAYPPGAQPAQQGAQAQTQHQQQQQPQQTRTQQQQQTQAQDEQLGAACIGAGLTELEPDVLRTERELHALLPPWPLADAAQAARLPWTLLSTFAAEGDNVADAKGLAAAALAVLRGAALLRDEEGAAVELRTPCSWGGLWGAAGPLV